MKKLYRIAPLSHIPVTKDQFFTYSSEKELGKGDVVSIPLGRQIALGVAYEEQHSIDFPASRVKSIKEILPKEYALTTLQLEIADFIHRYYVSSLGETLKLFIPPTIKRPPRKEYATKKLEDDFTLNPQQQKALDTLFDEVSQKNRSHFLLHGPTGSGKTEVYLQFAKKIIAKNQQVLFLIPEISLVPQTINRLRNRFGDSRISVLHSRISKGEKFREWQRIRKGESSIIIGARSSLFAPFADLGAIIMDESHDSSFKQFDKMPRYDSRTVCEFISKRHKILFLEGTATPLASTYYRASNNEIKLLQLTDRIHQELMPSVSIVDMREEFKKKNYSVFSERLRDEIKATLESGKQALLFVNRRGAASYVTCRSCGYVAECPECELPFTYHLYGEFRGLICHHCGKKSPEPTSCPDCNSTAIKFLGGGTQKVFSYAVEEFDEYRVERMDKDTTKNKHDHKNIFTDFSQGKIDILIGTQMITKGWDIANIGLVGIISADIGLHFPDFRSGEHVFQQLMQVAGRTGRGKDQGKVILQTYDPTHPIMKSLALHDYDDFYKNEISSREELLYPPFSSLFKIECIHKNDTAAFNMSEKAADLIEKELRDFDIQLLGPAPSFFHKRNNSFHHHVIVRCKNTEANKIAQILKKISHPDWRIDRDPISML